MNHHVWQLICIATVGVIYLLFVGIISLIDNDKK
jgi:hypothetical protein